MIEIAITVVGFVLSVVLWLLKSKDQSQQRDIEGIGMRLDKTADGLKGSIIDLYGKHEADVARLSEVEIKLASRHYEKSELDARFDRMEHNLGARLDKIAERLDKIADKLGGAGVVQ